MGGQPGFSDNLEPMVGQPHETFQAILVGHRQFQPHGTSDRVCLRSSGLYGCQRAFRVILPMQLDLQFPPNGAQPAKRLEPGRQQ